MKVWHIALLLAFSLLSSCSNETGRYNRGIGVYPGNPEEDFSPEMVVDHEYRNIALHRSAFNSSSYDCCLTANLLTDGIIEENKPQYISVTNSGAEPLRRERQALLDEHEYTMTILYGDRIDVRIDLHNGWVESLDRIQINGLVSYLDDKADGSHEIGLSISEDGNQWKRVHTISGKSFIGKESRPRRHTDPDKAEALGVQLLPTRNFSIEAALSEKVRFSHLRIEMNMKGAEQWILRDFNIKDGEERVNLISSKHFNSTWMSLGGKEEWVYVDLGNRASFDKVILHWLNRPSSGCIQVSDDTRQWETIAPLEGSSSREEITVKGKGRYLRVMMNESADNLPYMLSEIEVWGKGGMKARPKAQSSPSDRAITLSGGNWKLSRQWQTTAEGSRISTSDFDDSDWIAATVPGTVLSSFVNIGAVPDPNFANNIMNISESYFNSDFWYRNTFDIPEDFFEERLWLELDGINWKAEIYLNGVRLGNMEGAFIRGRFDITDIAIPGTNTLAVKIIKNANYGAVKEKNENDTGRNGGILGRDNPTFHATIGWDWITTTRGRNIGIWNDVRICKEGNVSLDAPYIHTTLPLPDTTSAILTPEVLVKNNSSSSIKGLLRGRIGEASFEKEVSLLANEQKCIRFNHNEFPQLKIAEPELWWPNGYGRQHLYEAGFEFIINGKVSDSEDFKVGIRQVDADEDGGVLHLYVNGRRFIGRGGNWGFSESNLNYRGREYDIAVEYQANCNFNIMRNWVGQTGDMELYEACDRHGIMVWQDFWLANPSDGPNPDDKEMFLENAEDYIKRIRRYPSMLIYCGRNEGYPPENIDKGLRSLLKQWHPDLHYISSSADDGVSGHGPYRAMTPKEYFAYPYGNDKFHSERGMPNVMTYESMERTYSEEGLWPQGSEWYQHDYTLGGAQGCASFNGIIEKGYGPSEDAKQFSQMAQNVNYDGYRAMFESRSKNRKGLLLWMSHPCWPSMTWQTYDWYFETNGGYYGSKKGAEPLHIQWNSATDTIEVVNYNAKDRRGLMAKAMVVNTDGSIVWERSDSLDIAEDSTAGLFRMEFPDECSDCHFIKLILSENGKTVSDNFYINGREYGNHTGIHNMKKASLKVRSDFEKADDGVWTGRIKVLNESDVPAVMVRINITGRRDGKQILPMFYQDNYFSLLPGEEKEVSVKFYDADTRGNAPKATVTTPFGK